MATHHVHCVVVMRDAYDGSGEPYVWGIVSDLDLLRGGLSPDTEHGVGRLAEQPTISVRPSLPLRQAAELMVRHAASHLIVIDEQFERPIAVLSTLDVAGVLAWGGETAVA